MSLEAARRYLEIGRPQRALEALAGAEPGPESHCLRGYAHLQLEDFERAVDCAREGLSEAPADVELLHLFSVAEAQRGRLAEAELAILAALEQYPENVTLLCRYADLLMRGAQLEKAQMLVMLASRLDPEALEWREAAVTLEYLLGHDDYAEQLSRDLLAADPRSVLGHRMLGVRELNRGNVGAAQRRFADAVREQPADEQLAAQARHARELTRNPLWWPTLLVMKPGVLVAAFGVPVAAAVIGGATPAALLVIVVLLLWIWGMLAPAILGWPGRV